MSDLFVATVKIVFLVLLWLFILFVADVIRRDMFGRTVPAGAIASPADAVSGRGASSRQLTPTRFTVTRGSQLGLSLPVQPTINLGRASDSTFHLDDDYASSRHAQLVQSDTSTWVLHDLNSTNGTFVNGRRITAPTPVTVGDVIRIGKTFMQLEA